MQSYRTEIATTIHRAAGPTYVAVKRTLARGILALERVPSPILRYGFAVLCVAVATGLGLAAGRYGWRDVESPLFNLAIVLVTWHAGLRAAVLAFVLSAAAFTYFFTEPLYSFEISAEDLPNFVTFAAWAAISAWFVNVRARIEQDLRSARDHLQVEVERSNLRAHEIRQLNEELAKRAAELESSNKELESFAYSVSHDLRAPLRHLVGYSELLHKQASALVDDKSRRYIQTIIESAKRMGNLIDDLLAFSRIGRAETKTTLVNLDQVVKEVVNEIGQDTKGRDIAWNIGALPRCYGDRSMLKLVFVNLLSNAAKFTRMRARPEIEVGCAESRKGEVDLFVRDNGAGFDMQYVNKLFGVFQRLHRAEQFEGTGIGLAMVQRIVHRHGGQVRAEGAVDKGATFYVTLPKAPLPAERTANTP